MRTFGLTVLGFALGFAASIGVFYGLHFFYSAVSHGGLF
jgi:hypothetical protein